MKRLVLICISFLFLFGCYSNSNSNQTISVDTLSKISRINNVQRVFIYYYDWDNNWDISIKIDSKKCGVFEIKGESPFLNKAVDQALETYECLKNCID